MDVNRHINETVPMETVDCMQVVNELPIQKEAIIFPPVAMETSHRHGNQHPSNLSLIELME